MGANSIASSQAWRISSRDIGCGSIATPAIGAGAMTAIRRGLLRLHRRHLGAASRKSELQAQGPRHLRGVQGCFRTSPRGCSHGRCNTRKTERRRFLGRPNGRDLASRRANESADGALERADAQSDVSWADRREIVRLRASRCRVARRYAIHAHRGRSRPAVYLERLSCERFRWHAGAVWLARRGDRSGRLEQRWSMARRSRPEEYPAEPP